MTINMHAVRAARRLLRPVHEQYALACEMDHAVCPDGYGAAYVDQWAEAAEDAVLALVANRFDIPVAQLRRDLEEWGLHEHHRMMEALFGPQPQTCTKPAVHAEYEERGIGDQCPHCVMSSNPDRLN